MEAFLIELCLLIIVKLPWVIEGLLVQILVGVGTGRVVFDFCVVLMCVGSIV